MTRIPKPSRGLFYKKDTLKTTWMFRVVVTIALVLVGFSTRWLWEPMLGNALTCEERVGPVDAIVIDNIDQDYLLFKRAAVLHRQGLSDRVLVPTFTSPDSGGATVDEGFVRVMAQAAGLKEFESILFQPPEPFTLGLANHLRDFLKTDEVTSVMLVATGFRSRRSLLVYERSLAQVSVDVSCVPVFGTVGPEDWTNTLHGIQTVLLEFLKLQYYRFYVLPFHG